MTATPSRSDERRAELVAMLGEEAEKLRTSAGWVHWLDLSRRVRNYSLGNQLLILRQRPGATLVMGYRAWQAAGRQVLKGERGIAILAPVVVKHEEEGQQPERRVVAFKPAFVFDVAQTSGPELPPDELPEVRVADEGLRDELIACARAAGFVVEFVASRGDGARGWFLPATETIYVVDDKPTPSQVRTLLHELAHAVDPKVREKYVRAERELVAESAAYLAGTSLGVDTSDASAVYSAHWGADRETLMALAAEVLLVTKAVEEIVMSRPLAGLQL